jgi:UDP-N-acetyl-D-mannosaminuronic acid dehydrogenase
MKDTPPVAVIVGLGYVGLTLGVALARRGIQVYGI